MSNTSQHDIRLAFIRPGKPVENEYIESFNGKFRDVQSVRRIGVEPWDNVREGKRHEQRHDYITTIAARTEGR